ncbi:hypothetical protein AB0J28_18490 [Streptosporangium canum]|uniref:hypothetical protein n=1 Tax=Streptosporangium canum TaxID=324952 RepID=UPI00343ABB1E
MAARRTKPAPPLSPAPPCADCAGEGQLLIPQSVGRGARRKVVNAYALCLTCSSTAPPAPDLAP